MKLSTVLGLLLLGATRNLVGYAQDGGQGDKIEYAGIKFLPVHWILSVEERGKTVVLEDSSVWQICPFCCQAACKLWPLTVVSIQDRGDTYRFPYRISVLTDGQRSFPLNAACMKDPRGAMRARFYEEVAQQR